MGTYQEQNKNEHFVAHLKIERVERTAGSSAGTPGQQMSKLERAMDEVTQMTVKAPTLAGLVVKLRAHIAIIADEEEETTTTDRDTRPHSRSCGHGPHPHGKQCQRDCPTCGGVEQ